MKKTSITVTEASRNFADCVNRAHYQNVTFVLLKNGEPDARLVPDNEKVCVGRDLAEALAKTDLPENEARVWHRDLEAARKSLVSGKMRVVHSGGPVQGGPPVLGGGDGSRR